MQKRRCSNCGKEDYEYKMFTCNTGRVQWICSRCYLKGHNDAKYRDFVRDMRIRRDRDWNEKK